MKTRLMMIATALMTSLICLPASAQPGPGTGAMGGGMTGMGPGMGAGMGPGMAQGGGPRARAPRDCSQAPNPTACTAHREARAKAVEACKDSAGPQRRQCMHEQMQNFDCAKSGNPQQCESRKMAYKECQGQAGPAFRQCVQQKMPPVDCSKAPNQARCDLHQKAREACKDKLGPEHKACLREQFNVK
uniref:Uncharacterized protein n=1 Tax=Dechloromonas aromatica (strain RCB) TaxID=159087 RepID=Q47GX5_DECAR